METLSAGASRLDEPTRRLTVAAGEGVNRLFGVFRDLDQAGIAVDDIGLRRPTLDDVFLSLTGHTAVTDENETIEEAA